MVEKGITLELMIKTGSEAAKIGLETINGGEHRNERGGRRSGCLAVPREGQPRDEGPPGLQPPHAHPEPDLNGRAAQPPAQLLFSLSSLFLLTLFFSFLDFVPLSSDRNVKHLTQFNSKTLNHTTSFISI